MSCERRTCLLFLCALPLAVISSKCYDEPCHAQNLCPWGFVVDSDGCETCECSNPCEGVKCYQDNICFVTSNGAECLPFKGRKCHRKDKCPNGYVYRKNSDRLSCECIDWCHVTNCPGDQQCITDPYGQLQCVCSHHCPPLQPCDRNCKYGTKKDSHGCNTCECLDACHGYSCPRNNWCRVTAYGFSECVPDPKFTKTPEDKDMHEGDTFYLACDTDADPYIPLTWTYNGGALPDTPHINPTPSGTILSFVLTPAEFSGTYTCVAEGGSGAISASAEVVIKPSGPPVFIVAPEDQDANSGSDVEFLCEASGKQSPSIVWLKDHEPIETSNEYVKQFCNGSLFIHHVKKYDEGKYTCVATNNGGTVKSSAQLTVLDHRVQFDEIDAVFFTDLFETIKENVLDCVERTVKSIRDPRKQRTPQDLLRVFKYPTPAAHKKAIHADVFDSALQHIRNNFVSSKDILNEELLTPSQLEFLASLSGCVDEEHVPDCADVCENRKYRTVTGECNNLRNPSWGAAAQAFVRVLPASYDNDRSFPRGWSKDIKYNGHSLPSARKISNKLVAAKKVQDDDDFSLMIMQWGQFLDHDLDLAPIAASNIGYASGELCSNSCEFTDPCFPIHVPEDDTRIDSVKCLGFIRSSAVCSYNKKHVVSREQINENTGYIDASMVYGSSEEVAANLRDLKTNRGLLRAGIPSPAGKANLPPDRGEFPIDCGDIDPNGDHVPCLIGGDVRVNEQLALTAMHTIWLREHNRLADGLREINPHWDGDKVYEEARSIVAAQIQRITYADWLPKVIGEFGMDRVGSYSGYDPTVNAGVSNEFATAAFRMGHALIRPILFRLNCTFEPIPEGNLPLHKAFFSPQRFLQEGGADPLIRGLFATPLKLVTPAEMLNNELTEKLFLLAKAVGLDLASLNIQRGRDHGLASYNAYRKFCGFKKAHTFEDFKHEITNPDIRQKLKDLYGHPDNVDLWVGSVSEDRVDGGVCGPTFACLLSEQFKRSRDGDRFWHESPGVFSPAQLTELKQANLARVICDNGDKIEHVQLDVFQRASFPEGMTRCEEAPSIDLTPWKECCEDCVEAEDEAKYLFEANGKE